MAVAEGQCPVALQKAFVKKKNHSITPDSNISNHCSPERHFTVKLLWRHSVREFVLMTDHLRLFYFTFYSEDK